MWTDIYLKANTQAEILAALPDAWMAEGEPQCFGPTFALDMIGTLYRQTETGLEALEGFHANLRLKDTPLPPDLEAFVIGAPTYPKRVFA